MTTVLGSRTTVNTSFTSGRSGATTPRKPKPANVAESRTAYGMNAASTPADGGKPPSANVRVICRFRPETRQEHATLKKHYEAAQRRMGLPVDMRECTLQTDVEELEATDGSVFSDLGLTHYDNGPRHHAFAFDRVLRDASGQHEVFDSVGRDACENVMNGINSCVLCYGQTGSGKTHTMLGPSKVVDSLTSGSASIEHSAMQEAGLVPRCAAYLIDRIRQLSSSRMSTEGKAPSIKLSYIEIYNEKLFDLLNEGQPIQLLDRQTSTGVYQGRSSTASVARISDLSELLQLVREGAMRRTVAPTAMNSKSSRSHAILTLTVTVPIAHGELGELINQEWGADPTAPDCTRATLTLVDLAGSEKVSKSSATGMQLEEANKINLSLLYLGMVVRALSSGKSLTGGNSSNGGTSPRAGGGAASSSHVPYMNSKLTRLLSDTLGGNALTCIVLNCSSSCMHVDETISTLRFGERARKVRHVARTNVICSDPGSPSVPLRPGEDETQLLEAQFAAAQRDAQQRKQQEKAEEELKELTQANRIHEEANAEMQRLLEMAISAKQKAEERSQETSFECEVQMQVERAKVKSMFAELEAAMERQREEKANRLTPRFAAKKKAGTKKDRHDAATPSADEDSASTTPRRVGKTVSFAGNSSATLTPFRAFNAITSDAMDRIIEPHDREVQALRDRITTMEKSHQEEVEALKEQLSTLGAENTGLREVLRGKEYEVATLNSQVGSLQSQLADDAAAMQALEGEHSDFVDEAAAREAELLSHIEALEAAISHVGDLALSSERRKRAYEAASSSSSPQSAASRSPQNAIGEAEASMVSNGGIAISLSQDPAAVDVDLSATKMINPSLTTTSTMEADGMLSSVRGQLCFGDSPPPRFPPGGASRSQVDEDSIPLPPPSTSPSTDQYY